MSAEQKYIFRIASSNDRVEIVKLLYDHFYPYDPMSVGWITQGDARDEDIELSLEDLDEGNCIVAIESETSKIVGVICNAVHRPGGAHQMLKKADESKNPKWAEHLRLYAEWDELAGIFKKFKVDASFHVHALVVHNDHKRRSIALNLVKETHRLGASLGYKLSTINCSSAHTIRMATEKIGMKKIFEMAYEDVIGENGQKLIRSTPPHTHFATVAIELK